jgi:proteasome lid subunit RPN8/RPN11
MQGFVNRLLERVRRRLRRARPLLVVEQTLWEELFDELSARGGGVRESGAFLLGNMAGDARPRRAVAAVYYDDLDPTSLTGGISFSGSAYGRLWDECELRGLAVVADVHTHPGPRVAQSSTDRAYPMVAQRGHIALIVPDFAEQEVEANQVGVHEYLGDGQWRSALGVDAGAALRIDRTR